VASNTITITPEDLTYITARLFVVLFKFFYNFLQTQKLCHVVIVISGFHKFLHVSTGKPVVHIFKKKLLTRILETYSFDVFIKHIHYFKENKNNIVLV